MFYYPVSSISNMDDEQTACYCCWCSKVRSGSAEAAPAIDDAAGWCWFGFGLEGKS